MKLGGLAFTILGTQHCLAPEVILGDGYGLTCDIWAVGVCLHEFLCGPLPYGDDLQCPHNIFIQVLTANLKLPPDIDSMGAGLIRALLLRDTERRPTSSAARLHSFFCDFSFKKLLCASLTPPFMPDEPQPLPSETTALLSADSGLSDVVDDDDDNDKARRSLRCFQQTWMRDHQELPGVKNDNSF